MRRFAVMLTAVALLAGCTNGKPDAVETTVVQTQTLTRSASPPPPPPRPATTVTPLPPNAKPPAGEVEAPCPYIETAEAAELEGNRIYRTTVAGRTCRFYFWSADYHATLEIAPTDYPTATDAYNAMVLTGRTGTNLQSIKDLVPGVDAVLYQTAFYGRDGNADWACTFAKGRTLVTVRTDQTNVSFNARHVAETIAPKF